MVGCRVAFVYAFASGGDTIEKSPGNCSEGIFEFLEIWFSWGSDLDDCVAVDLWQILLFSKDHIALVKFFFAFLLMVVMIVWLS
jgi:hypothetical protein